MHDELRAAFVTLDPKQNGRVRSILDAGLSIRLPDKVDIVPYNVLVILCPNRPHVLTSHGGYTIHMCMHYGVLVIFDQAILHLTQPP